MGEREKSRLNFIVNVVYYAVIIGLAYLCYRYVLGWVMPFVVAFVLVSIIQPIIRRVKKLLHINHWFVSLLVMLLIYLIVIGLIVLLIVQLVIAGQSFVENLPQYYENVLLPAITQTSDAISGFLHNLPPTVQEWFSDAEGELIKTLQSWLIDISQRSGAGLLSGLTSSLPSFAVAVVFTVMLSFFISMQYDKVIVYLRSLLSERGNVFLTDLKCIVIDTCGRYLRSTITLMMITAIELAAGLLLLRVPSAVMIAIGIAIFDALPYVGTGAIMIPWVFILFLRGDYTLAIGIGILYAIVTVVRNIIEPKILADKLGLNPIVSLVSIYLGFRTMGVLGMIFMPLIVQIIFALHQNGNVTLLRHFLKTGKSKFDPPEEEDTARDPS